MNTLCTQCTPRVHCKNGIGLCTCSLCFPFPGPRWFKKGGRKLLLASRRSDAQRRRKTAGNISDGLRCCIWRRAENPAKMTHSLAGGGKHNNTGGYIALVHPNALASRQPEFLARVRASRGPARGRSPGVVEAAKCARQRE